MLSQSKIFSDLLLLFQDSMVDFWMEIPGKRDSFPVGDDQWSSRSLGCGLRVQVKTQKKGPKLTSRQFRRKTTWIQGSFSILLEYHYTRPLFLTIKFRSDNEKERKEERKDFVFPLNKTMHKIFQNCCHLTSVYIYIYIIWHFRYSEFHNKELKNLRLCQMCKFHGVSFNLNISIELKIIIYLFF